MDRSQIFLYMVRIKLEQYKEFMQKQDIQKQPLFINQLEDYLQREFDEKSGRNLYLTNKQAIEIMRIISKEDQERLVKLPDNPLNELLDWMPKEYIPLLEVLDNTNITDSTTYKLIEQIDNVVESPLTDTFNFIRPIYKFFDLSDIADMLKDLKTKNLLNNSLIVKIIEHKEPTDLIVALVTLQKAFFLSEESFTFLINSQYPLSSAQLLLETKSLAISKKELLELTSIKGGKLEHEAFAATLSLLNNHPNVLTHKRILTLKNSNNYQGVQNFISLLSTRGVDNIITSDTVDMLLQHLDILIAPQITTLLAQMPYYGISESFINDIHNIIQTADKNEVVEKIQGYLSSSANSSQEAILDDFLLSEEDLSSDNTPKFG